MKFSSPTTDLTTKAKIFCYRIAKALADDLAGILDGELDLEVFVPFGIDLELALTNPPGIVFVNTFDLEIVVDVEFFQSGPDRESDVPSLGVKKRPAPQLICLIGGRCGDMLPGIIVGKEHAVILSAHPWLP
jgi:hypothetical protein